MYAQIERSLAELGQLAIVEMFLPLAYGLRQSWNYQRLVLVSGSLDIATLTCARLIDRARDLKLFPLQHRSE